MRDRTDQGIAQRFRLGVDPRVAEGVCEIETVQHSRRVGQNGIDPLPDGVNDLAYLRAKIDC